jgi:hypothetical protein
MCVRTNSVDCWSRFTQPKFNLLREENEGYAKLITALLTDLPANSFTSPPLEVLARKLIGSFFLDPNRVVDLSLEALEYRLQQAPKGEQQQQLFALFAPILQMIPSANIAQLLGFRLQMYHVCNRLASIERDREIERQRDRETERHYCYSHTHDYDCCIASI